MRKDEEFSEWYNEVIERSELSDKRYPIKGMNVWRPYGWAIMKLIDQAIRDEFDSTGHGEVNFPVLIPESEFKKEAEHVKGFEGDVFWVTRGGFNELDIKLVLRPTSETAMYPMFKLWIRSHADLPLKVYQIVPVFRYETKMTRSFMRVREIHFFEAHTAHATFEDAEQQIHEDLQMNERVMRALALPYIVSGRPSRDVPPVPRQLRESLRRHLRDGDRRTQVRAPDDRRHERAPPRRPHFDPRGREGPRPPACGGSCPGRRRADPREGPPGGDAPRGPAAVPRAARTDARETGRPGHPARGEILLLGGPGGAPPGRAGSTGPREPGGHGRATRHRGEERVAPGAAPGPPTDRPRAHAGRHVEPGREGPPGQHLHNHEAGGRSRRLQPDGLVRQGIVREGDHGAHRDERPRDAVLPGAVRRQVHRLRREDETARLRRQSVLSTVLSQGPAVQDHVGGNQDLVVGGMTKAGGPIFDRAACRRSRTRRGRSSPRMLPPTRASKGSTNRTIIPR